MAGRPPAADRRRRASAALFVLVLAALVLLNLAPAPWAEASRLRDTVPKVTPTRPVTATRTATPGPGPSATPTPTLRPGQPSPTPVPPGAVSTPVPPVETPETAASPAATEPPAPGATAAATEPPAPDATAAATSTPVLVRDTPVSVPAWVTRVLPPAAAIETLVAGATPPVQQPFGLTVSAEGGLWCGTQPGARLLRWADKPAVLDILASALTTSVCIFFSPLDTGGLAEPPAGYAFGSLAANVQLLSYDDGRPGFSFMQPVTLTLPLAASDSATGAPAIGFLGEASTGWALLKSNRDQTALTITARSRRPGTFAILVGAPQAAATEQTQPEPSANIIVGAVALLLLLVAGILLALRQRRRASP